jgi:hypothetical protein
VLIRTMRYRLSFNEAATPSLAPRTPPLLLSSPPLAMPLSPPSILVAIEVLINPTVGPQAHRLIRGLPGLDPGTGSGEANESNQMIRTSVLSIGAGPCNSGAARSADLGAHPARACPGHVEPSLGRHGRARPGHLRLTSELPKARRGCPRHLREDALRALARA